MKSLWKIIALLLAAPARADLYTWTDADGTTHFSSKPPSREEDMEQVEVHKTRSAEGTFEYKPAPAPKSGPGGIRRGTAKPASAEAAPPVELYTTSSCPRCVRARDFLDRNEVAYTEYNVDRDSAAFKRFKDLGGHEAPLAIIGGEVISGYSAERYEQALENR